MQLPQNWVQEYHLYSQIVSNTKFRGWKFKAWKCPGTRCIYLKGRSVGNVLENLL